MGNAILKMAHQHEIAGLEPAVEDGKMVNVAEHRAGAIAVSGVDCIQRLAQACNETRNVGFLHWIDCLQIWLKIKTI